jgi:tripartite-type tricarboxylate transporter receptor subunit TctC
MRSNEIIRSIVQRAALVLLAMFFTVTVAKAQPASGGPAGSSTASSSTWPDRPVHLIVPFPAGSSSDIIARLVVQKLGERLGQQVVVENRPGASGSVGTEVVAHAAPDGYTLGLANTSTHTVSPNLMVKRSYDPLKDFAPISMIGAAPFVIAIYPGLPVHSVADLIALAKAKPGKLTFASAGPATLANLAGVLFAKMASVELTPVSYRGTEQEILDVIQGRVDMQFGTIPPSLQLIRDGKVRGLAVTGAKRSPTLPDVPTIAESGLPGYESVLWQALYAPVGTPAPVIVRLNAEVNTILREQNTVDALAKIGVEAEPGTPQQLADRIAAELKKWHDVVAAAGIPPQ